MHQLRPRFLLTWLFLNAGLYSAVVQAQQFGIGLAPGLSCGNSMQPAGASFDGFDDMRNMNGQVAQLNARIEVLQSELNACNKEVNVAKKAMGRVLRGDSLAAIEAHRTHRFGPGDYETSCFANGGGSVGSPSSNPVRRPYRPGDASNGGSPRGQRQGVPGDFCDDEGYNYWNRGIADDGGISEAICDAYIPPDFDPPSAQDQQACVDGLNSYYEYMDECDAISEQLAQLREDAKAMRRGLNGIGDEVVEGDFCPFGGSCPRRGTSTLGVGGWLLPAAAIMVGIGSALTRNRTQGYSPMMMQPQQMAYQGAPYMSAIPGMNSQYMGYYGTMPGSMGMNSLNCMGGNNFQLNNMFAQPIQPFANMQFNPFANPFMGQNQAIQNSLFNPGYGPNFGPTLGNGTVPPGGGVLPDVPGVGFGLNLGNNSYLNFQHSLAGGIYNPNAPFGAPYWSPGDPVVNVGGNQIYMGGTYQNHPLVTGYNPIWGIGNQWTQQQNLWNSNTGNMTNGTWGNSIYPAILPMPTGN